MVKSAGDHRDQVVLSSDISQSHANIGQFTDPGFDNPLNVGGELTEEFTFTINWGYGTPNKPRLTIPADLSLKPSIKLGR